MARIFAKESTGAAPATMKSGRFTLSLGAIFGWCDLADVDDLLPTERPSMSSLQTISTWN